MSVITQSAFAARCGVSEAAVSQRIKAGKLRRDPGGGLDDADPVNAAYLARSGHQRTEGRAQKRRRARAVAPPVELGGDGLRRLVAEAEAAKAAKGGPPLDFEGADAKERAEIRRINAQARAAEAKLAREVGRVIERDKVRAALGRFGAAMQDRLLTLGTRLAPKLEAVFDTGGRSAQIRVVIDDEMAEAIKALKQAAAGEGLV